jgi:hypothetical protein
MHIIKATDTIQPITIYTTTRALSSLLSFFADAEPPEPEDFGAVVVPLGVAFSSAIISSSVLAGVDVVVAVVGSSSFTCSFGVSLTTVQSVEPYVLYAFTAEAS